MSQPTLMLLKVRFGAKLDRTTAVVATICDPAFAASGQNSSGTIRLFKHINNAEFYC